MRQKSAGEKETAKFAEDAEKIVPYPTSNDAADEETAKFAEDAEKIGPFPTSNDAADEETAKFAEDAEENECGMKANPSIQNAP